MSNLNPDIFNLDSPIVFFPVRHHSPACARLVRELALELKPAAILIEGPSDFNSRLDELTLPHKLPIAIYTFTQLSNGKRRGAFYPYCIYSPEWQAIQVGQELDALVRFIDLPWSEIATAETTINRYGDREFKQSNYVATLCEKLGVEDFDNLWDTLFEIDSHLTPTQYLERCHQFCFHVRNSEEHISETDARREAFMAQEIYRAREEFDGKIIVVTGGFHSYPLYEIIGKKERVKLPILQENLERGIALTPYSYERLDNLAGYDAGMPNPGFYHYIWQSKLGGETAPFPSLIARVAQTLRQRGQVVSAADLIAVETTARGLAALRSHERVWRQDLIDGITGSLVKEELEYGCPHPFLQAVYEVFRGGDRGLLAPGTERPPFVSDLQQLLHEYELEPTPKERKIELDLYKSRDIVRSKILHRLRILELVGYRRSGGSNLAIRDDLSRLWEQWSIVWSPEFEGCCIEASIYGVTLLEAAAAKLLERAETRERDAENAALILLDACLMGLNKLADSFYRQLVELIGQDSDFFKITRALTHLLYLYRYDEVLGTKERQDIGKILVETFQRSLWLLETLGQVKDRETELLQSVKIILETFERGIQFDKDLFVGVFERVSADNAQIPLLRGVATGVLWVLHAATKEQIIAGLRYFSEPLQLGDFLTGFFSIAREIIQRHGELMLSINEPIMGYNEEEFLEALPGLRLAFSYFTPREKYHIARTLLKALGMEDSEPVTNLEVSPQMAANVMAFEAKLFKLLERYGVRQPQRRTGELGDRAGHGFERGCTDDFKPLPPLPIDDRLLKLRWRLVLGNGTEFLLGGICEEIWQQREEAIAFLYDREYSASRNVRLGGNNSGDRQGSLDESQLTVPDWINSVHELFPKKTVERLEKDALERYQLEEIVTNPELLSRAQPNQTLLKAVLRTKHLMNQDVLVMARQLVRQVIEQLLEKLARQIESPFIGVINRQRRSFLKVAKNFDAETTIQRNLSNYDPETRRIYIKTPYFFSRIHRHVDRWQIIIVVDESGSMLDSVIYSAVTAAIFFGIKSLRTHLCLFDTSVVDVTEDCNDPVETIMRVQLGGGTDIGQALSYAASLVDNPRRTIIILITDFYEGAPVQRLLSVTKQLVESGVTLLGLAALDDRAEPCYDKDIASRMVALGAHVGAMTPGELAEWVAQKVS